MASPSAIQATRTATFRPPGIKPASVQVFASNGHRWIVAADLCRLLGFRTDQLGQLVPEQHRGHATVLTHGSVQSVTTLTEEGAGLLLSQAPKSHARLAKALRDWLLAEVLPGLPVPPRPRAAPE